MEINELSRQLESGNITSRELIERCLHNIEDVNGQGSLAFLTVYKERALDEADLVDLARSKGIPLSPYSGIPISIKDLFDCVGEVTTAGSRVLDKNPPAPKDATIVAALRQAGFILIGKNNMTEFAYSGLGINGHFGTPLSPYERDVGRIPGGSSSGGAVSVSDAMAAATIGTDTGGSCRIPAAFCGITGFKPTAERVPRTGVVPLSHSLDSVGPLANSVSCCAILDSVMSGGNGSDVNPYPAAALHVGVLEGYTTEQIDSDVAAAYESALTRLSAAGVTLVPLNIAELGELPNINSKGGMVGAEAAAWHRELVSTRSDFYDPWVRARLEFSSAQTAADYLDLIAHRERLISLVTRLSYPYDALVLPTVQIIPPTVASLTDPDVSNPINQLSLRNTSIGNFLNRPSISIPCHAAGSAPVGFMLMGENQQDLQLLSIARGVESIIRSPT